MDQPIAKPGAGTASGSTYRTLRQTLGKARRRAQRRLLGLGLARVGGLCLTAIAAAFLVLALRPGGWGPPLAGMAIILVALIAGLLYLILPLMRLPSLARYTRRIDEHLAGQDRETGEFLNALELGEQPARVGTSDALIGALVQEQVGAAGQVDLDGIGRRPLERTWRLLPAVAALVLLGLLLVSPARFATNLTAVLELRMPQPAIILVESRTGDVSVERGNEVQIIAAVSGTETAPTIHVRRGAGVWRQYGMLGHAGNDPAGTAPVAADSTATAVAAASAAVPVLYAFTIPAIDQLTHYRIAVRDAASGEHRVTVIEPLRIVGFELTYHYPDYARLAPEVVQAGDGQIAALPGTRVEIRLETNHPLASGTVEVTDGSIRALALADDNRARGTLTVSDEGAYELHLRRQSATPATVFGPYSITPSPDRQPLVALLAPGEDVDLPRSMVVELTVHGADDYGLTSLHLNYSYEGTAPVRRQLARFTGYPREVTDTYSWNLAELDLLPGDLVTYYLEIYDNDTINGPKRSRTRAYVVRVPTMVELYAEVEEVQGQSQAELEQALERSEELQQSLEDLAREMKKFPETTWEDRQEIQSAFERQQQLRQRVGEVAQVLDQALERMENQEMVNEDVMEKLTEIQDLLQQITDPELKEALRRLGESMSELNDQEIQRALNELEFSQEDMLRNLEKTIEMLQQVQNEEQMERAIQLAEQMLDKQEEVNEGLEKLQEEGEEGDAGDEGDEGEEGDEGDEGDEGEEGDTGDQPQNKAEELKRLDELEQEAIEDTEALQKMLEELSEQLAQQRQEMAEELAELAEQTKPDQPMRMDMEQAQQQMNQGNSKGAQQSGESAESQMQSALNQMRMLQQMMMNMQNQEAAEKIHQAALDLLWVSDHQEGLLTDQKPASNGRIAERQQRLLDGTRKINTLIEEISRTSMMVGTSFAGILGQPMRSMENATRSFESNKRASGRLHAYQALTQLNEVISDLLDQEESMCMGGGCSGMKASMQKMEDLSQQQSEVNKGMREMLQQMGQGRLSESSRQRMARMAAQQRMIQQGLQEAAQTLDQRRDVLGRLGDLAGEMEDVAEEMERSHVDERIIRQQERFLTRLLDAQRSIRKRDLGRERKSRPGIELMGAVPTALPEELLSARARLEADILRGRSDLYPPAYRELVERYFRALAVHDGRAGSSPGEESDSLE